MIYLFSLLALILLLPILYFVPIGISKQGKLLIAGISFGLTLLGIVASGQYPMWAIAIMLMVILGFASYMIDQRFSGLMVVTAGTESDVYEEPNYEVYEPQEFNGDLHNEEVMEDTAELKIDNETLSVEELPEQIESMNHKEELLNDGEEALPIDHIELIQASVEVIDDSETDTIPASEDESEWFIENTNEMTEEVEVTEEENELFDSDLSEIESMIANPDLLDKPGVELEEADLLKEDMPEVSDEPGSESDLEEFDNEENEPDLGETFEESEKTTLESIETGINHPISDEDVSYIDELPKRNRIMRDVMKTMIDQISLSRSLLSTDQLENMIKHYLHPSLHDQDYYTFARILMDHYISTEQYEDFGMFINGIEERFSEYPYIIMDIEQTKEFALINQTK